MLWFCNDVLVTKAKCHYRITNVNFVILNCDSIDKRTIIYNLSDVVTIVRVNGRLGNDRRFWGTGEKV